MNKHYRTRRQFLKRSAHAALLGASGAAVSGKMSLMGSALAAQGDYATLPGYKALVCVFLYGGSDSFNLFVPREQAVFDAYTNSRGSLASGQDDLISDRNSSLYFHRNLPDLRDAYDSGNLAVVRNVGNLIEPITRSQYQNNPELVPADLFAHNSAQEQVQKSWSSRPVGLVGSGWGGRMADLLMEANGGNALPPTLSMNNANFFQPGNRSTPISIDPLNGPQLLPYLDGRSNARNNDREAALQRILGIPSDHLIEQFASSSFTNARNSARLLSTAINSSPEFEPINTQDKLLTQMRMVSRAISGREQLGMRRQIFFVGLGGWDTHDNQTPRLDSLATQLNTALASFQQDLRIMGVENEVTTFTVSDFGRTLTINGDGSDHGWGGHYLVMGGAVNGGQLFGNWPQYQLDGSDDAGRGRVIPELSINQYGAALGSWMGLSNSDLLDVFPDLDRFDTGWQNQYGLFG